MAAVPITLNRGQLVEYVLGLNLEELNVGNIEKIKNSINNIDEFALVGRTKEVQEELIKRFIHLVRLIKKLTDNPTTERSKDDKFLLDHIPLYQVLSSEYKDKLRKILFNKDNNNTQKNN